MGDPYTDVSITGYNTSPPPDDGSETAANRVDWSKVKDKVGDPLKAAVESINSNVGAAVDKVVGGAGVSSTSISYTVQASDQGKLIRATTAGITITTPAASTVGSPFVFAVLNNASSDITLDGSASETVDGSASITVPGGGGLFIFTDGTNWFTSGANFARTRVQPQGRLTLVTGNPVISSDQAAKTSVFFTPYQGNLIPLPNSAGTDFETVEFSELTLALNNPNHVADTIYDVYVYNDAGTIKIATGPAWTTSTAGSGSRGTGGGTAELTSLKGLYVNANSMTVRNGATTDTVDANEGLYVGTIIIDGTAGQVTCHVSSGQSRIWGVWNAYNRLPSYVFATDATSTWSHTSTVFRASNNDSNNSVSVVCGLAEEWVKVDFQQVVENDNSAVGVFIGIGKNSTTTASGRVGVTHESGASGQSVTAKLEEVPFIGLNTWNCLEKLSAASASNYYGTSDEMIMRAEFMA